VEPELDYPVLVLIELPSLSSVRDLQSRNVMQRILRKGDWRQHRLYREKEQKRLHGKQLRPSFRNQWRRAVGASLAERNLSELLAVPASGVTTSGERCIA